MIEIDSVGYFSSISSSSAGSSVASVSSHSLSLIVFTRASETSLAQPPHRHTHWPALSRGGAGCRHCGHRMLEKLVPHSDESVHLQQKTRKVVNLKSQIRPNVGIHYWGSLVNPSSTLLGAVPARPGFLEEGRWVRRDENSQQLISVVTRSCLLLCSQLLTHIPKTVSQFL